MCGLSPKLAYPDIKAVTLVHSVVTGGRAIRPPRECSIGASPAEATVDGDRRFESRKIGLHDDPRYPVQALVSRQ